MTGTPKEFDFVDIECEGETLAVFDRDIKERTEEVRVGERERMNLNFQPRNN